MANVLIAYDNMPGVELHDFFECCSDDIRQICVDTKHHYTPLTPPFLIDEEILALIISHDICYIAAHGDTDGIVNDKNDYIISTNTPNYNFKGKILYTVCCSTGQNLKDNLLQVGVRLFVGYDDNLIIGEHKDVFVDCVNSGIESILDGNKFAIAKEQMLSEYDYAISRATLMDKLLLLHNREHLVFEGDMNATI